MIQAIASSATASAHPGAAASPQVFPYRTIGSRGQQGTGDIGADRTGAEDSDFQGNGRFSK